MRPNTKVFLIESPANPLLEITDIAAVGAIAREIGAKVVVDNVFATPIFQKPLQLGADVVVYSATKHIDGQGRVLGGAILGETALLDEAYRDLIRHTGPALSPFNAWVLLNGPGDAGPARAPPERDRRRPGRPHRRPPQGQGLPLSGPARPPAVRDRPAPDDRRRQRMLAAAL